MRWAPSLAAFVWEASVPGNWPSGETNEVVPNHSRRKECPPATTLNATAGANGEGRFQGAVNKFMNSNQAHLAVRDGHLSKPMFLSGLGILLIASLVSRGQRSSEHLAF